MPSAGGKRKRAPWAGQCECRSCSKLEKPQLLQPDHTNDTQTEVTSEEVEQQCSGYFICIETPHQPAESVQPPTVATGFEEDRFAAANAGESGGVTLRNDEAHENVYSINTQIDEDTDVSYRAQVLAEDSKPSDERDQETVLEASDKPMRFNSADIEYGTGQEGKSSNTNTAEGCNRQRNVSPAAKPQQLYPSGRFVPSQDLHLLTDIFVATALPSSLHEVNPPQSSYVLPSNSQRLGTTISIPTGDPPTILEPPWSPSPPRRHPALLRLTPQYHPFSTSLCSKALRQDTKNGEPQTSLELPVIKSGFESDDTILATTQSARFPRGDLITLVPHVEHLGDKIIDAYLNCLTRYANTRNSCNSITMIGSTDPIPCGLLGRLAVFSMIYVPIKVRTHWLLAVLYPGSPGRATGRVLVYDSHQNWTNKVMTASNVSQFLGSRLADEFSPGDWTLNSQQFSQTQQNDADSGLYLLANAKSIALGLRMVQLCSDAQRMALRWQFAHELVTGGI